MIRPNRCTLLLVDDSAEDREVYRRYLEQNRECLYRIVEAETGAQAIQIAAERRPDCILLDYRLPDADGVTLLTQLLRQSVEDPYAIVMLTGAGEVAVAVQALKGGALDYLDKNDLSADRLHRSIQYALGHAGLKRELNNQRLWSRALLRSINEAVIAGDSNGRISFMNGAAEALTGWPAEMAVGQAIEKVYRVINQQTRQPVRLNQFSGRAAASGGDQSLVFVARDGNEIPVDHSYAPITAAKGEFIGSVIVARDVTRKRQSESTLREREERYALAMRATGDAIWDWDVATDKVWCNETFDARFGDGERPQGRPVTQIHPDDRARVLEMTTAALDRRDIGWALHYRCQRPNGSYVSVLERAVIVRDPQGQALRVVASILDADDCKTPDGDFGRIADIQALSALAAELRDGIELARVAQRADASAGRTLAYVTQLADRLLQHLRHHAGQTARADAAAAAVRDAADTPELVSDSRSVS